MDKPETFCVSKFLGILKTFGLQQHVYSPTHRSQHTLDLMISKVSDSTFSGIHIHDAGLSDHYAVHCVLPFSKPPREVKAIVYRKLRVLSIDPIPE